MNVTFEPALSSEATDLAELRVVAMRDSLERIGRFDPNRARERLMSAFDASATRHVVADGRRAGFYVLHVVREGLQLEHLYIHPDFQGRGLGARTLAEVFAEADRRRVDVRVGALKQSASNPFYLRHGFEPKGEGDWDIYYVRRHRCT